jgi:hypothetical protein
VGGKAGYALDFARTGYVHLGSDAWLNQVTNFTLAAWVKPDTSGKGDRHILQRFDHDAPNGYLLQLWTDDELYGYQSVGGNFYALIVHAPFPHDGTFHHAALTFSYDGTTSTTTLYIDGQAVRTASVVGAPDVPASDLALKCGNGFEGVLDEVYFFTRTLYPEEVAALHADGAWYDTVAPPPEIPVRHPGSLLVVF